MINFKRGLAALAVTLAVSALASPSYAQGGGRKISPRAHTPFTSAACSRPDIRSTSGVTWRFISTAPA
jgi:hypothetical protein